MNNLRNFLTEELLKTCLYKWGEEAQIRQAQEECSEFITAYFHLLREKCSDEDVASEIADVMIIMEQMRFIFGKELVDKKIDEKLTRLKERLGE